MKIINYILIFFFAFILWHGYAQTWSSIGFEDNTGGGVLTLKAVDNKLYVGGGFLTAGGITVNSIASWDGSQWDSLGNGITSSDVKSIEKFNNEIYVGGGFSPGIRRWNGSNWSMLGGKSTSGIVYSIKYKNELYVGGGYNYLIDTSGNQTLVRNIASWNGSDWNKVGGGVSGSGASGITAMTEYKSELIVAGYFECIRNNTGDPCDWSGYYDIARWDGTQWNKLDSGVNARVVTLLVDTINDVLYAGGDFLGTISQTEGSVSMRNIGKWDGNKWSALPGDSILPVNSIYALSIYNGYLYAGMPNTAYDTNFVRFDGKQWEILNNPSSSVLALEVYQGDLYVGGGFEYVNGDSSMRYLARFNTPNYCDSVNIAFSVSADTVELSDSAMMQTSPSGFSNQYQWDFGDSSIIDTAEFPTHYYTNDGVYTIKLKSTFGFCPWDSAMKTVIVVNDVGIKESAAGSRQLKIYPNPTGGSFTVEIEKLEIRNCKLQIFDAKGKLVKQLAIDNKHPDNYRETIETKNWAKGVYFVNLVEDGKMIAKEKVVVE